MKNLHAPGLAAVILLEASSMRCALFTLGLALSLALSAVAQHPPVFDAASVKASSASAPATAISPNGQVLGKSSWRGCRQPDPGMVTCGDAPLRALIVWAYAVRSYQVEGPAWIDRDGYDVVAKLPAGVPPAQAPAMMQALLAERFHLVVRKETRPYPGYAITVAKGGPHLTEVNAEEVAAFRNGAITTPPARTPPGKSPPIGLISASRNAEGITVRGKMTMAELASYISNHMQRPVVDLTQLDGVYDLRFTYQADESSIPDPASTLVHAVEQALGLRIEEKKTPLEFIIVDSANRAPTEN